VRQPHGGLRAAAEHTLQLEAAEPLGDRVANDLRSC
jgi:hypothetical protein